MVAPAWRTEEEKSAPLHFDAMRSKMATHGERVSIVDFLLEDDREEEPSDGEGYGERSSDENDEGDPKREEENEDLVEEKSRSDGSKFSRTR